jgi:hypothetical protein
MPAEFSVHVDPEELELQRLAAAAEPVNGKKDGARPARKQAKPQRRDVPRGKAGSQGAPQRRQYAFRRS